LFVQSVPLGFVLLAEVGEVFGFGAVAAFVGLVGLGRGGLVTLVGEEGKGGWDVVCFGERSDEPAGEMT
jgi:hypothetical protein